MMVKTLFVCFWVGVVHRTRAPSSDPSCFFSSQSVNRSNVHLSCEFVHSCSDLHPTRDAQALWLFFHISFSCFSSGSQLSPKPALLEMFCPNYIQCLLSICENEFNRLLLTLFFHICSLIISIRQFPFLIPCLQSSPLSAAPSRRRSPLRLNAPACMLTCTLMQATCDVKPGSFLSQADQLERRSPFTLRS